jgi:hypothetical protein
LCFYWSAWSSDNEDQFRYCGKSIKMSFTPIILPSYHSALRPALDEKKKEDVLCFMTRFKSRRAHGRGEQWNARDTRFYTGSVLYEDKNPIFCVRQLYYDSLDCDHLYPSFYKLRGRVYMKNPISYYYIWSGLYLYFSYLQDLIYNYLLKCLGYEPPTPCLSGQVDRLIVDLLLLLSPGDVVIIVPNLVKMDHSHSPWKVQNGYHSHYTSISLPPLIRP